MRNVNLEDILKEKDPDGKSISNEGGVMDRLNQTISKLQQRLKEETDKKRMVTMVSITSCS